MTVPFFDVDNVTGVHGDLELLGEALAYTDQTPPQIVYGPLDVRFLGPNGPPPRLPDPPILGGTQPLRTEVDLTWTPVTQPPGLPAITSWVVERRTSTDNGVTFGAWAGIAGSPFAAATLAVNQTGLATGTPERLFQYRIASVNSDGQGQFSNVAAFQWNAAPPNTPPSAPTNFSLGVATTTSQAFNWQATTDSTVVQQRIVEGAVVRLANIDPTARSAVWGGLTPGSTHTQMAVQRANLAADGVTLQWSPVSNRVASFTVPTAPPPTIDMLVGSSDAGNGQGGFNAWDLWRIYTKGNLLNKMDMAGASRPLAIFYSEDGGDDFAAPSGSKTYQTVFNHYLAELNDIYYTNATGQTHTGRWGIRLYFLSGNENSDKGTLSGGHSAAQIAYFRNVSMKGLYDACHYIDPTTGQRRFPDAYAGSNPTQNHEQGGIVAEWLEPSALYHDIVVWSMYPPGRQSTVDDPTFNWPSFTESRRTNLQDGFLIRCFYRTKQAEAQARIDSGNASRVMMIGCGEVGIGQDPGDSTTRPYYAVHALLGGMAKLSAQYSLPMPGACWWDNSKGATSPQNILNDEPATTNPSTAEAIRDWQGLNHQFGGTHPASWSNNPKAGWKTTGTPV